MKTKTNSQQNGNSKVGKEHLSFLTSYSIIPTTLNKIAHFEDDIKLKFKLE